MHSREKNRFSYKENNGKFGTEVNQAVNQTKEPFRNVLALEFGEQYQSLS